MEPNYTTFLFFTGKGGVGKTSLACATAVTLADQGLRVLLISTDPASNLQDVLQTEVGEEIAPHRLLPLLHIVNINPEVSAAAYRDRVVAPMRGLVPEAEVNKVQEGLSGACTTEIASFDEFSRFITGEGMPGNYDHVIFDTAPTGHTIRLLELPAAWEGFLEGNPAGASCIGPSSALKSSKDRYSLVVDTLRNAGSTTFYLVSRPDAPSLKEAAKTSRELKDLGLSNQRLMLNGVFTALDHHDETAVKMELLARKQLDALPALLQDLSRSQYPLLPYNVLGLEKLRSLFSKELQEAIVLKTIQEESAGAYELKGLTALVDALEAGREHGLIMTMGKGGVGKTIVASAIAVLLAQRGHKVLLTTTDPAAHIRDFLNQLPALPASLQVERIDPKAETQKYTDKVLAQKGANLDEEGRKLLREDLQSPCTEEVAVFHAFSRAIQSARRQFVVMDTAPTGHTLLLLDTTGSYHREVLKNVSSASGRITTPYMALQDPAFASILLIALPETTPMREAEDLQSDLVRAGIKPYAWVVNQCLSALPTLTDPLLMKRAQAERAIIKNIEEKLSPRTYGIPYLPEEMLLPALLDFLAQAIH